MQQVKHNIILQLRPKYVWLRQQEQHLFLEKLKMRIVVQFNHTVQEFGDSLQIIVISWFKPSSDGQDIVDLRPATYQTIFFAN